MIWAAKRTGLSLLLIWVVVTLVFMAIHFVPGDPAHSEARRRILSIALGNRFAGKALSLIQIAGSKGGRQHAEHALTPDQLACLASDPLRRIVEV